MQRRIIPGHSPMEQVVGYSRAVVAGSHVWVRWLVEIEAEALIP